MDLHLDDLVIGVFLSWLHLHGGCQRLAGFHQAEVAHTAAPLLDEEDGAARALAVFPLDFVVVHRVSDLQLQLHRRLTPAIPATWRWESEGKTDFKPRPNQLQMTRFASTDHGLH